MTNSELRTYDGRQNRQPPRYAKRLSQLRRAVHYQHAASGRSPTGEATEQVLLERCHSLKCQLSEKTAQLATAQNSIEKCKSELHQFARAVSHDLQTPLRAVSGFSQFLIEEYQDKLDETAHGYIARVVDGAARMQELIRGLVLYSQIESRAAQFQLVNLDETIADALERLQERIDEKKAAVNCDHLPNVWGDQGQLTVLFGNLIENGLKFNESDTPTIHVGANQIGGDWVVTVSDNGIGIAASHQKCVFNMFRRLHLQHQYEGVGVGLATCRRIADRHQWPIWIESEEGVGTTTCVRVTGAADV